MIELVMTVNGTARTVVVPADRRLVSVLREDLRLTGTKIGCEVGACGACTVLVDGRLSTACLLLAGQVCGATVVTVEGIEQLPGAAELRAAFLREGGVQCGFCTSGQLLAALAFLNSGDRDSDLPEQRQAAMAGNLCRCTGYYGIQRAIALVAGRSG
jgi:carbon-monoxide dehydrogenase small subunit